MFAISGRRFTNEASCIIILFWVRELWHNHVDMQWNVYDIQEDDLHSVIIMLIMIMVPQITPGDVCLDASILYILREKYVACSLCRPFSNTPF